MESPPSSPLPTKSMAVALPAHDAVLAAFRHRFVEAQYVWTSFLLGHLVDCRKRIGDLDTVLILIVIGLQALRQVQKVRELEGEHIALGYGQSLPPEVRPAVNAFSIAGITGIPRETVRRKLLLLAERGWIEQAAGGGWCLRPDATGRSAAANDLSDLAADTVARIAEFVGRLATTSAAAMQDDTAMLGSPAPEEPPRG